MANINSLQRADFIIQAGHLNTPDGKTGGTGPEGDEIDWTPIVRNEAVRVLSLAGLTVLSLDASFKGSSYPKFAGKIAVFIHFDDPKPDGQPAGTGPESGRAVGYKGDTDRATAQAWNALYDQYWPFKKMSDNHTGDLKGYYGFKYTVTDIAEFVIEFGDLNNPAQAHWMKPRLKWMGALLAHFLSQQTGLGNVPLPAPVHAGDAVPPVAAPLLPAAPLAQHTEPFTTKSGNAYDSRGNTASTGGLSGTRTVFADGSELIDASETIQAHYDGKNYGPATARQTRRKQGTTTTVHQEGYCWLTRALPDVTLIENHDGFGASAHTSGWATYFGKDDHTDSGAGTPTYRIVQTCSDVFGASLKAGMMHDLLGSQWTTDPRRLTAMVEVYSPASRKLARVPLVEVGPGNPDAIIDLTWSLNKFLGTQGGANVQFRVIV